MVPGLTPSLGTTALCGCLGGSRRWLGLRLASRLPTTFKQTTPFLVCTVSDKRTVLLTGFRNDGWRARPGAVARQRRTLMPGSYGRFARAGGSPAAPRTALPARPLPATTTCVHTHFFLRCRCLTCRRALPAALFLAATSARLVRHLRRTWARNSPRRPLLFFVTPGVTRYAAAPAACTALHSRRHAVADTGFVCGLPTLRDGTPQLSAPAPGCRRTSHLGLDVCCATSLICCAHDLLNA